MITDLRNYSIEFLSDRPVIRLTHFSSNKVVDISYHDFERYLAYTFIDCKSYEEYKRAFAAGAQLAKDNCYTITVKKDNVTIFNKKYHRLIEFSQTREITPEYELGKTMASNLKPVKGSETLRISFAEEIKDES